MVSAVSVQGAFLHSLAGCEIKHTTRRPWYKRGSVSGSEGSASSSEDHPRLHVHPPHQRHVSEARGAPAAEHAPEARLDPTL
eukprot:3209723-Rhodomonas_salina.3